VSGNLALVRSVYAAWGRGDFSSVEWAHPDIEFVIADGPEPDATVGLVAVARRLGEVLRPWKDFKVAAEEIRELDGERVLVLVHDRARGKSSGVEIQAEEAHILRLRNGKVARLVVYAHREHALADLGLEA
jgi:ketosteroid isomerase-like protein